jgi:hypothetical protein
MASQSNTINVGPGPLTGTLHAQTKIRIEQIARMRISGIRDQKICDLLGINPPVLKFICQKPEYKETEEALLLGHLTQMDEAIAGKVDELRQGIRCAVPAALRCLVDAVNQRRDLPTALRAAGEILDRDPDKSLSKKTGLPGEDAINVLPASVFEETAKQSDVVAQQLGSSHVNTNEVTK